MDQDKLNKLMELKKLLEAGILTQEEMETEKAKVLGRTTNVATTEHTTEQQTTISISQNAAVTKGQNTIEVINATSNEQDLHVGQKPCPNCGEWIGENDEVCEWCTEWVGDYNYQVPSSSGGTPTEEEQQINSIQKAQEIHASQQQASGKSQSGTYDYSSLLDKSGGVNQKYVKYFGIGAVVVLILGIFYAVTSQQSSYTSSSDYDDVYALDSATSDDFESVYDESEQDESTLEDNSDENDEFAYDAFSGEFKINGGVYRLCDSYAYLSINKGSDGVYTGIMELMMGSQELDESWKPTGRFDDEKGRAHAQIRGKVSGNSLIVIMDSYKIANPGDGTIKEWMPAKGSQIFKITYNNDNYSVQPIGGMQGVFDGEGCSTTIKK